MKDVLYINDFHFSHSKSSSWYNEPSNFSWIRKYDMEHLVFTDTSIKNVINYNNQYKYAWLLESPEITSDSYEFVKKNNKLFTKIFSFDKELLNMVDNSEFLPIGGCWINEEERKIHKKNKLVSFIMSSKNLTSGHKFRHEVNSTIQNVDKFGYMNPISNKIDALKPYMFSIVIENSKKDFYFTEKIIDCFITGTIPIYWGCPSISNFFDIEGFFTFQTINELKKILNYIDEKIYLKKINFIEKNFEISKKYLVADDLIYNKIKKNNYEIYNNG